VHLIFRSCPGHRRELSPWPVCPASCEGTLCLKLLISLISLVSERLTTYWFLGAVDGVCYVGRRELGPLGCGWTGLDPAGSLKFLVGSETLSIEVSLWILTLLRRLLLFLFEANCRYRSSFVLLERGITLPHHRSAHNFLAFICLKHSLSHGLPLMVVGQDACQLVRLVDQFFIFDAQTRVEVFLLSSMRLPLVHRQGVLSWVSDYTFIQLNGDKRRVYYIGFDLLLGWICCLNQSSMGPLVHWLFVLFLVVICEIYLFFYVFIDFLLSYLLEMWAFHLLKGVLGRFLGFGSWVKKHVLGVWLRCGYYDTLDQTRLFNCWLGHHNFALLNVLTLCVLHVVPEVYKIRRG
jgi:hypothetical protein